MKRIILIIAALVLLVAATSDYTVGNNVIVSGVIHGIQEKTGLPDNSATSFVRIAVASDDHEGGTIQYGVHAQNATDVQVTNGTITYSLINDAGTEACDVQEAAVSQSSIASTGSLTVTFTCDPNPGVENVVDIAVTSNTTLGSLTAHEIHYTIVANDVTEITGL
jgi:hypothetical protein